jgi:hypothetical protein
MNTSAMVSRLPISERIFIDFLPEKIIASGHQSTAKDGKMNQRKRIPVE